MTALLPWVLTLAGLAVGSFLNVVVDRLPRGESLLAPASHCPACHNPIQWRHNIPVLSWLVLRGRCRDCRIRISARYPLVELVTGALFVAVGARLRAPDQLAALPAYLYFAAIGVALAVIDIHCKRLPNAIVLPSYPVVAVLLTFSAWWQHDWSALARAGVGTAALFGSYLLLAAVHPAGMGFGDVKLAGLLGALLGYLSWTALLIGAFAGFLLGAIGGAVVMATGRGTRKSTIPFGPFMLGGALLAIFAAAPIAGAYLHLVAGG